MSSLALPHRRGPRRTVPALKWTGGRLVAAVATLLVLSFVTFLATNIVPSDPARTALGRLATPAQLEAFRAEQKLDLPPLQRYGAWVGDVARGDLGTSTLTRRPVRDEISARLGRSLLLAALASLLAIPAALLAATYIGQRSGRAPDVVVSIGALLLGALPEFVIGVVLIVVFAVGLGWLPVESSGVIYGDTVQQVKAYVLPTLCLALVMLPYLLRLFRANIRDTLGRPFVRSALLRGLTRRRVTWRYLVPNAVAPTIGAVALVLAELMSTAVVVETVFGFPGIGKLMVESVLAKDIPTVQALALVLGLLFIVLNITAELLMLLTNPRLRERGRS
jgi:peptide/nickel transport system permease protein